MALGSSTFSAAGGAVSDLFAGFGLQAKAKGDRAEAQSYDLASDLATQNAEFTEQSTGIKEAQNARNIYKAMGTTAADVAGAGLADSGSALDIMRDNAQQGRLLQSVTEQQGAITEAGYKTQAQSYQIMSAAAREAADAADTAAIGSFISGGIKGISALATLA
jgi:hypothetical protein